MATQFQHRLVGTVILVALGVIFLPDLLDGKQPPMPEQAVSIPLRPELEPPQEAPASGPEAASAEPAATASAESWTLEEVREAPPAPPKPEPQVVSAPKPQPVAEVKPSAPKPAPVIKPVEPKPQPAPVIKPVAPTPQPAPQIKPVAPAAGADHVVQLGAFRSADNVNALVRKLQAAGYRVQTSPSVPRQGELNRVWVGPDAKARLQQQLPALERLTGLKGRVMAQ
ncbi:cell division protein DedD [Oceanimonas doudoroffii]|uniref:DedD protein n=1 Tax=Oceanimonas doudoroffii TaxID=84158 RepID=A0A233RFB2_9GAMM|nr:cell division protein DedD [Oceanimonas doudoroffii]OXY82064.1 DedD protein [Oceanimonas doudoroffii]